MRRIIVSLAIIISFLSVNKNAAAQAPQLTVDGKSNNGVVLQQLKIDIKVCGTVAKTTWQMVFKNNTGRILEGTLDFPLKDGCAVSRYALDINGKLREAVPVDRGKGTMVFEAIERRRVDPGLLEKVDGNTFRTRIYPINANSTRTVVIGYEEELPIMENDLLRYYLPLNLKDTIADFSLNIEVIQSLTQPVFDTALSDNLQFDKRNNLYTAALHKTNYVSSNSLSFSIKKPADATEVMLQEYENKFYYLINTRLDNKEQEKILPKDITLLWDASLSGTSRNIKKEKQLLDAYFKKLGNANVRLILFSNKIVGNKKYMITNGDWQQLGNAIDSIQYDGATNFGCLQLNKTDGDEFLLVSDGLETFSSTNIATGSKPVYCINSASGADYSNLKYISLKTGGQVIDLQKDDLTTALKALTVVPLRFMGILQNSLVEESYPAIPVAVGNSFSAAGIAFTDIKEIILQFGYGNKVLFIKKVIINAEDQLCENFDISKIFAQKKIAELDIQYEQNRQSIESIGKRFGIVTRNTSLIVLETVNDYLRYEIEPPAELRAEYDRIMKQSRNAITTRNQNNLQASLQMMNDLSNWWKTNKKPVVAPSKKKNAQPPMVNSVRYTVPVIVRDEEVAGSAGNTNTAQLNEENKLAEVVVTGYATQRRKSVTGSVTTVSADNISPSIQNPVTSQLQGRVAGVNVTNGNGVPGGSNNIVIRGAASANAKAPLYIIDGVAGNISEVDKDDIESIDVLQAASATVIYGATASGGAVIVTTKNRGFTTGDTIRAATRTGKLNSIDLAFDPETSDYVKIIKATEKAKRYDKYVELRKYYMNRPVYFFEVASYFLKIGDRENGIKILSNLAELENSSYELYKMLGYKLKEAGEYEGELIAFKKVTELRPMDPQSYRDYALALEDAGQYQQALEQLYEGMTKSYSDEMRRIYFGIEEIFLPEINRLIALHPTKLKLKEIPKVIIRPMPVDLRIVMNWNMNNTDIDLWVTDPNEEKCMYSHKTTAMGGRISDDFTEGLGPEQFILKNAAKGKYRIEINYYGDSQATLAGPTTVMAEIYTHFGMPNEEKRIVTLQMEKGKSGAVFIGEVTL